MTIVTPVNAIVAKRMKGGANVQDRNRSRSTKVGIP